MATVGWLSAQLADVPAGDDWLSARERSVLGGLRISKRRADWRLGRWTAKAAAAAWLGGAPGAVEIIAAPDGAPEAFVDGEPGRVAISLSHRAGCALAVAAVPGAGIGCDLELVEPRSDAFVREWLSEPEQRLVFGGAPSERALLANLVWTAKEAAAKVRREGLRLDVRRAVVTLGDGPERPGGWRPLRVDWTAEGAATEGWWAQWPGWVLSVAGEPPPAAPTPLT